jgi:hypothetical protein
MTLSNEAVSLEVRQEEREQLEVTIYGIRDGKQIR